MKRPALFLSAGALFVLCAGIGFDLSVHKPLWRDELNTQTYTLSESYSDILLGHDKMEGNTAPLFYLLQKIFCDLFRFHTPQPWLNGDWTYHDPSADIFLRILPVFYMSAFFVVGFVYLTLRFNAVLGLIGVLTGFCSIHLWLYWDEARPYGLWVLLTGVQLTIFLDFLQEKKFSSKKWAVLSVVHILLSLTCILSAFQIVMVCAMSSFKRRQWLSFIPALGVPLALIKYYQPQAPGFDVIFLSTPAAMLLSTVPWNQVGILLFYAMLLRISTMKDLFPNSSKIIAVWPFFAGMALMLGASFLFLDILYRHATGHGQYVIDRHIIFLVPAAVIGVIFVIGLLWESLCSYGWIKIAVMASVAGLWLVHAKLVWSKALFLLTHNLYL